MRPNGSAPPSGQKHLFKKKEKRSLALRQWFNLQEITDLFYNSPLFSSFHRMCPSNSVNWVSDAHTQVFEFWVVVVLLGGMQISPGWKWLNLRQVLKISLTWCWDFSKPKSNSNSCESAARRRHPTRFASLIKEKHLIGSKVIKFRPSGFFSAKMWQSSSAIENDNRERKREKNMCMIILLHIRESCLRKDQ